MGKDENIAALRSIINRFVKGAKIPAKVLGVALAATSITSCTPITGGSYTRIENFDIRPDQPYDKTIANGTYHFHNFLGQKPDIIPSTATQDINNYLDLGTLYIQDKFDDFNQSIAGRPGLVRYFTPVKFNPDERYYHYPYHNTPSAKFDRYINQIASACEIPMTDMVRSLRTDEQKEALILCIRAMNLAAYREGLGEKRDGNNRMVNKYNQELSSVLAFWLNNSFLNSFDVVHDIENNKCRRVTDKLYTLLCYAKENMRGSNSQILGELKLVDVQKIVDIVLLIPALEAAHDTTAEMLNEQYCTMNPQIIQKMYQAAQGKDDIAKDDDISKNF